MTPDQIDFSVDYQMIKNAEKMLIGNRQVTPKQAFNWIHSPVKELWERSVIGGVGSILIFFRQDCSWVVFIYRTASQSAMILKLDSLATKTKLSG